MLNSTLQDCESLISTMIVESSLFYIIDSTITNMTALVKSGGVYISDNSWLTIENSTFIDNYGESASDILINNCQLIFISFTTIYINHNKVVMSFDSSFVSLEDTVVVGNPVFYIRLLPDSIIILHNLYNLEIQRCVFTNLNSLNAPIRIDSDDSNLNDQLLNLTSTVVISSSTFSSCSSQSDGGVLFLNSYFNISISNCQFISNMAVDSGGVLISTSSKYIIIKSLII